MATAESGRVGLEINVQQALVNFKTKDVREQTLYLRTQKGEITLVLKNIVRIEGERN